MKPLGKTKIEWSPEFAYAIGLLASDGNLSPDGRHICFTSKDYELAVIFRSCLKIENIIGKKSSGAGKKKIYNIMQFSDVNFYNFLLSIGLTPKKSLTIGKLKIPRKYFYHFLRGCFDGDGNICEYKHPQSKFLQLKMRIFSGSKKFLDWLKRETTKNGIVGHFNIARGVCILEYSKTDSVKLIDLIYKENNGILLGRKYDIAKKYLRV